MKNRVSPTLLGGALLVACVAGVALWRVRAASRDDAPPAEPAAAADRAPAPPAPAPAAPPPPPKPPALSERDLAQLDEARLMARLRAAAESDPPLAIKLAREGNRRFPRGADVAERTSILIHALSANGQAMEARGEAERMVNDLPDSAWVREVERFTGAHRHRNVRINDAGALEYYDAPNK
ncbi:MAG TPA: hypothetical protein VHM31_15400 [Polyangia bacterium]|nr:hypothetical protein [Polyangia bacterium]